MEVAVHRECFISNHTHPVLLLGWVLPMALNNTPTTNRCHCPTIINTLHDRWKKSNKLNPIQRLGTTTKTKDQTLINTNSLKPKEYGNLSPLRSLRSIPLLRALSSLPALPLSSFT